MTGGRRRRLSTGRPRRPGSACGDYNSRSECHRRSPVPVDVIEPFQPAAPRVEGQPALPPSAVRTQSLPAFSAPDFATLVDLSVADLFRLALPSSSRTRDQPAAIRPSWGLSTVFGATILAAGGYYLACGCPIASEGAGFRPGRKPTAPCDDGSRDRPAENLRGKDSPTVGGGGYRGRWEGRSMPSFFKRFRRVLG